MRRNIAPLAVLLLAATQTAVSAQTTTVQSLMDDGYTVAGVNTSVAGGGGVYLQKGNTLVLCHREARLADARNQILQAGEIVSGPSLLAPTPRGTSSKSGESASLGRMPWPPRRSTSTEVQLQREVATLGLKLLKANSELRTKTLNAERLEVLLRERLTKIDQLTAQVDQLRHQNKQLDEETEHYAAMVAAPQGNAAP